MVMELSSKTLTISFSADAEETEEDYEELPEKRIENNGVVAGRVSFYTGTGNNVPRLVTNLTDFFEENKEFSKILGKIWNFNVVSD